MLQILFGRNECFRAKSHRFDEGGQRLGEDSVVVLRVTDHKASTQLPLAQVQEQLDCLIEHQKLIRYKIDYYSSVIAEAEEQLEPQPELS